MKSLRSTLILGSLIMAIGVCHSGVASAAFDSFGSDIPLESAAKQIVPAGYSVDYAEGVDKATTVSWSSSSDWKSALSSAVAKKGLKAEFGSDTVVIVKSSATATRPYSSSPASDMVQKKKRTNERTNERKHVSREKAETRSEPRVERETAKAESNAVLGSGGFTIRPYRNHADASVPADKSGDVLKGKDIVKDSSWQKYDGKGQFVVEEGYMLHSTLNAWAEATGWKVAWHSDHDYLIEANATFSGDFVKASSDLIKAMRDARPQITVDYYQGNKVIVISNKLSDEVNK